MAGDVAPWFVVRPGAQRKSKLIKVSVPVVTDVPVVPEHSVD